MSWRKYLLVPQLAWYGLHAPRRQSRAWDHYWGAIRATGVGGEVLWDAESENELVHALERLQAHADPSLTLLDVGCGNGRFTRSFAAHFGETVGVDVSNHAIERARGESSGLDNVSYRVLDVGERDSARDLATELGSVNVYMRGVLHVLDPARRALAVENLRTLLGPRGVLYLVETNIEGDPLDHLVLQGATPTTMPEPLRRCIEAGVRPPSRFGDPELRTHFAAAEWDVLASGATPLHTVPLTTGAVETLPGYFAVVRPRARVTPAEPRGFRVSLRNAKEFQDDVFAFCERRTFVDGGYREIVRFDLFGDHYLVNDPVEVGRILTSNPDDGAFTKEGLRFFDVMRRLLGRGLFTAEGPSHLRQRRLLQPLFNQTTAAAMAQGMCRAADALARTLEEQVDTVVDVERATRELSSDIAAYALLGADLRGEAREFAALADEEEEAVWQLMTAPVVLPAWVPGPNNVRLHRSAHRIRALVRRMIATRRASIADGSAPDVILTRMTERIDDAQLLDEVVTLVVGGYKTLAVAHAWTFYLLAMHPEVAQRVRDEIGNRSPTADDLPRLKYTRMVVQESLRLYPPIWGIFRIAAQDVEVGGLPVARGSTIFMSPYTLHRNPRYWPDAEVFDPENFRPGIERPGASWLPFGAGRHKCIGIHYAMNAMVLTVGTIARCFAFDPPPTPIEVTTRSFTSPKGGMHLRLRRLP